MNRKTFLILPFFVALFLAGCKTSTEEISLIPLPVEVNLNGEGFTIKPKTKLVYNHPDLEVISGIATELWKSYLGFGLNKEFAQTAPSNAVVFTINDVYDETIGDEGYRIDVNKNGLVVSANKPAGILYGSQTVYQLLSTHARGRLPGLQIADYPRFVYRGLHLDVSRHFYPSVNCERQTPNTKTRAQNA